MWGLIMLSVPIFYIIGVIAVVKYLFGNSESANESRKATVLKEILPELRLLLKSQDLKTSLTSLIEKYKKLIQKYEYFEEESGKREEIIEEKKIVLSKGPVIAGIELEVEKEEEKKVVVPDIDFGKVWSNWYTNNSINLLLYVGAFLIVSSGAIFVGFQWGTIAGILKAFAFSFMTILFLVCGILFYRIKSIQSAGFTFISIAAILTPFNGVAWLNFHFAPLGYEAGSIWLVTSIVSVALYLFLAFYLRKSVFMYVFSIGVLSLVLSVVNIYHLRMEFYILGSVFTAFALLLAEKFIARGEGEEDLYEPLAVSAQVVMPLSLLFGLFFALSNEMLLEYPTAFSLFLSSVFYILSYNFFKNVWYLVTAQIIFPASVYILLRSSGIIPAHALLITQVVPIIYLLIRQFVKDRKEYALNTTNSLAVFLALISFGANMQISNSITSLGGSIALISLSLHFLTAYLVEWRTYFLTTSLVVLPFAMYCFMRAVGIANEHVFMVIEILGISYIGINSLLRRIDEYSSDILQISQFIVPIAMAAGAILSINSGRLSFGNLTIYTLIAMVFYIVSYFYTKIQGNFVAGAVLFPVTFYLFCRFLGFSSMTSLNVVQITGIAYMSASFYLKEKYQKEHQTMLSLANIIMPLVAIIISFLAISINNTLFIPQVVFSVFSGTLYYVLSFLLTRNKDYLFAAEVAFLWFIVVFSRWLGLMPFQTLLLVNFVCALYAVVSYLLRDKDEEIFGITTFVTIIASTVVFASGLFIYGLNGQEIFYLSVFPTVFALFVYITTGKMWSFLLHVIFQILTLYLFVFEFLNISSKFELLGVLYLVSTIIYYFLGYLQQESKDRHEAFVGASIVNGILALMIVGSTPKTAFYIAVIESILAFHYQIRYGKRYGIYLGSLLLTIGAFFFIRGWSIGSYFQPYIYQFVFIILYIWYCLDRLKTHSNDLRTTGLAGSFLTVTYFGLISNFGLELGKSALACSYILTIQFAFDAWYVREKYFGYFASFIGMITYFWQVHILGYSEYQVFLLPLGVYFLILSYFTRNENNSDIPKGLEYGGFFVLLVPLLFQSFGENGFYYSLLLGLEGIVILLLGVTFQKRIYRLIGVGAIVSAVFSQTYNYVFSLPRWVSTAVAGLIFISVAIFLLLKRKNIEE